MGKVIFLTLACIIGGCIAFAFGFTVMELETRPGAEWARNLSATAAMLLGCLSFAAPAIYLSTFKDA